MSGTDILHQKPPGIDKPANDQRSINNRLVHSTTGAQVDVGATCTLCRPALPGEVGLREAEETEDTIRGSGRILVMDDEEIVRDPVREMLIQLGYDVLVTSDGAAAVEKFRQAKKGGNPFDAVILDLTVPGGMGGRVALQMMKKIAPRVRAIVSSGYSNDPIMANFKKFGFRAVIPKPYRAKELGKILHQILAKKTK